MSKESNKLEKKDAFVVTKPLQYINVLNIESKHKKVLLIVDLFIKAKVIFEKIKENNINWDEVYFFENMDKTFNWLIKNRKNLAILYIDSDINRRNEFYLLRKLNVSVYEEGVGTYRKRQYKPRRKILGNLYLLFLRLRGYKNRRGGNKYTKNIIVYFPEFYKKYIKEKKRNISGFKKPFIEHINSCKELQIFDYNIDMSGFIDKTVALYISGWEIDENELKILNEISCEKKIIKPHPHQKKFTSNFSYDLVIPSEIPVEILILQLIKVAKKLYLISKYSSSTIYFLLNPKVEVINISPSPTLYNDSESYLDAYKNLAEYLKNIYKNEVPLSNI